MSVKPHFFFCQQEVWFWGAPALNPLPCTYVRPVRIKQQQQQQQQQQQVLQFILPYVVFVVATFVAVVTFCHSDQYHQLYCHCCQRRCDL